MTRRWGRDAFRTGLVQAVEGAARRALAASTAPGLAVALVQDAEVVWAAGYVCIPLNGVCWVIMTPWRC